MTKSTPKTKSQRSRAARTKGHSFEREVARALKRLFPDARRRFEFRAFDNDGVDLEGTGKLAIQCKRSKSSVPMSKIEEVKADGIAVLVSKVDRKPAYVTLGLDDFISILSDVGIVYENRKR